MKKILIIEDDQIVANVYRNKLAVEGYAAEVAPDGETGLRVMRTFKPNILLVDLMLPGISGVDVIKEIRAEPEFSKVPMIVFSNTYLTNLIQEAWRAGANKCLSKSSCTPKDVIEIVRQSIGDSGAMTQARHRCQTPPTANRQPGRGKRRGISSGFAQSIHRESSRHAAFAAPGVAGARQGRQRNGPAEQVYELYRQVHALNGNAGLAGLARSPTCPPLSRRC